MNRVLRARWVLPIERPPIENGAVVVRNGAIVEVRRFMNDEAAIDLGDVALMPGLVNCHTHLEFSDLSGPLCNDGADRPRFADWIRLVVERKRFQFKFMSSEELANTTCQAIAKGIQESTESGVVAIGEICTSDWSFFQPAESGPTVVPFRELLGLKLERGSGLIEIAKRHVESSGGALAGLSPHAPYTVNPILLTSACALAAERKIPLAMHLAESLEEIELLRAGSGELVQSLKALDAWDPTAIPRGLDMSWYLEQLSQAPSSLVIHGNFLSQADHEYLAGKRDRMTLVFCPRTYDRFNPGRYPLSGALGAGVRLAIATDSRATNPDLRLWDDARFVANHYSEASPESVLRMITLAPAEALQLEDRFGSIAAGKLAKLTVLDLASEGPLSNPFESLFRSRAELFPLPQFLKTRFAKSELE